MSSAKEIYPELLDIFGDPISKSYTGDNIEITTRPDQKARVAVIDSTDAVKITAGSLGDTLLGGDSIEFGNDTIDAGAGDDRVSGLAGRDSIYGGDGNDTLAGGNGNDTIVGGAGNDSLDGGSGDDVLNISTGDSVTSGAGFDRINLDLSAGFDAANPPIITDFTSGEDKIAILGQEDAKLSYDPQTNKLLLNGQAIIQLDANVELKPGDLLTSGGGDIPFVESTYKISGTVYNDTNATGSNAIEAADEKIPDVKIELFAADANGNAVGAAIDTATTGTNGSYEFAGLGDASYVVRETQPNGFRSVTDKDGGNPDEIQVTLAGADSLGNDFLEEIRHRISGTVYNDTNAPSSNAIEAADARIAGVKVELFAADANGNAVGNVITTATTSADGSYAFTGLGDRAYVVKETQPNGFRSVADKDGGNLDEIKVTLAGEDSLGNDFLEEVTPPVLHKISGTVYNDTNAPDTDRIEAADARIADVKIDLFAADANGNAVGNVLATTMTGTNGSYEFADLGDGSYVVKETQPAGFDSVADKDGGNLNEIQVTLAGADSLRNDFLEEVTPVEPPALYKISGAVYNDTNAPDTDRIEAADARIADVKIDLFAADASGNATGDAIRTATTGADGSYEFTGLGDRAYVVKETQPAGFDSVADKDGGDLNEIKVTLAGADSLDNHFLEEVTPSVEPPVRHKISGTVYNDTNAPDTDRIEAADEKIAGVKVDLFAADASGNAMGAAIRTATTGTNGSYEFADLGDGSYVVKETQPAGFRSVADKDGGNLNEIKVTLVGEDSLGNDFLEEVIPVRPPNGPAEGEKTKVYEFFRPSGKSTFYTVDENEKAHIAANLSDNYEVREGQAFRTLGENEFDPITGAESEKVYRFFNTVTGSHLYTSNEDERDYVEKNLKHYSRDSEKSEFYAYETEVEGSIDVHRFYNPIEDVHVFTHSDTEMADMMAEDSGFNDEGTAFYMMPETMS